MARRPRNACACDLDAMTTSPTHHATGPCGATQCVYPGYASCSLFMCNYAHTSVGGHVQGWFKAHQAVGIRGTFRPDRCRPKVERDFLLVAQHTRCRTKHEQGARSFRSCGRVTPFGVSQAPCGMTAPEMAWRPRQPHRWQLEVYWTQRPVVTRSFQHAKNRNGRWKAVFRGSVSGSAQTSTTRGGAFPAVHARWCGVTEVT